MATPGGTAPEPPPDPQRYARICGALYLYIIYIIVAGTFADRW